LNDAPAHQLEKFKEMVKGSLFRVFPTQAGSVLLQLFGLAASRFIVFSERFNKCYWPQVLATASCIKTHYTKWILPMFFKSSWGVAPRVKYNAE